MCLYPTLIRNRTYTKTKKNGGIIPPVTDTRTLWVSVGCENCIECRKQKAKQWQTRLLEDIKVHKNGKFITLTFSDEHVSKIANKIHEKNPKLTGYELDNAIAKYATRHFLERWRKEYKKSVRHWLVTELGHTGTHNIHLHGIIWTNEPIQKIEKHWQYGFVWKGKEINGQIINYVNEQTVNYIIKYVHKLDLDHIEYKSRVLTSPGIGRCYMQNDDHKKNRYNGTKTKEYYKTRTGHKISLPIYWRNKIYSEKERQLLWIQKLDKQERWICGERVDISKNLDNYFKLLKWHRIRNRRLGYGNNEKNWDRKEYEKTQREIMLQTRIARWKKKKNIIEEPIIKEEKKAPTTLIERQITSHWHPLEIWE